MVKPSNRETLDYSAESHCSLCYVCQRKPSQKRESWHSFIGSIFLLRNMGLLISSLVSRAAHDPAGHFKPITSIDLSTECSSSVVPLIETKLKSVVDLPNLIPAQQLNSVPGIMDRNTDSLASSAGTWKSLPNVYRQVTLKPFSASSTMK